MKMQPEPLALSAAWFLIATTPVSAQPVMQPSGPGGASGMGGMQGMGGMAGDGMTMRCMCGWPMGTMMQGPMGVIMMVLASLLILAVIGVLVALTVFLLRRSRPPTAATRVA